MPLTITRRPGETIRIGDDIEVKIGEFNGRRIRVSITAPAHVLILRGEAADNVQHHSTPAATRELFE